jgi:hypothetical protein
VGVVGAGRARDGARFHGDRVLTDGVVGLIVRGDAELRYGLETCFTLIGPPFRVTRAEPGVLHELDGKPAADVLAAFLGDAWVENALPRGLATLHLESPDDTTPDLLRIDGAERGGPIFIAGALDAGRRLRLALLRGERRPLTAAPRGEADLLLQFESASLRTIAEDDDEVQRSIRDRWSGYPQAAWTGIYGFGEIFGGAGEAPRRRHHLSLLVALSEGPPASRPGGAT